MAEIIDLRLDVRHVADHPGRRLIEVDYELRVPDGDPLIGEDVDEEVVVRARDAHDAPTPPADPHVRLRDRYRVGGSGSIARHLEHVVDRTTLDVEEDWWRSGPGGEVLPIAELLDHLVAELVVTPTGRAAGLDARSPVLTGSWGALGAD